MNWSTAVLKGYFQVFCVLLEIQSLFKVSLRSHPAQTFYDSVIPFCPCLELSLIWKGFQKRGSPSRGISRLHLKMCIFHWALELFISLPSDLSAAVGLQWSWQWFLGSFSGTLVPGWFIQWRVSITLSLCVCKVNIVRLLCPYSGAGNALLYWYIQTYLDFANVHLVAFPSHILD